MRVLQTLVVGLVSIFIGSVITWAVTHYLDAKVADEKVLVVSLPLSQNLASFPQDVGNSLEVRLLVQPNNPEPIKSLFGYQLTITNTSARTTAENISLYVFPPAGITLLKSPKLTTNPETLAQHIQKTVTQVNNGFGFVLDYLPPQKSATYSFVGYSKSDVGSLTALKADAKANGWRPRYFEPDPVYGHGVRIGREYTYSDYPDGTLFTYEKTNSAIANISSLLTIIGVTLALIGSIVAIFAVSRSSRN